jgi:chromosome segregation ATPase
VAGNSTQFGGTIKLEGEAEYRKALSQIGSDLRVLGSEMSKVTAEFGRNDKSVEGLTSKNKVLADQIESQKSKIATLKGALAESSEKYGENDKRTQAWQVSLNKAEAELMKMEKELGNNNSALEKYKNYNEQTTSTVNKLDGEIEGLNGELEKADAACKKSGNSTESLKDKQEILGEILGKQSEKVSTLQDALETSKSAFGENSDETKKWQNALNSAEKELNGTQQELKNVDNQMQSTSKSTSTFGEALKAILAADVIKSSVKMLGDSIKDVGKYMSDAITGAAAYGKEISLMSEKTGVSTENLQKFQAAARTTGVDVDTFTSTLARSIRSMNSASSGSGAVSKAYSELGVAVTDSNGQLRNSEEVYWDTIDALKNMSNETQRDAYSMQIFGKSAMELNPIIKRGSEGFREITDSVVTFNDETIETMCRTAK